MGPCDDVRVAVQAALAWEEKGGLPRAQRGPVAGATTKFSRAPSIGVSGFVPVWARSIFSSSRVVVRVCCLTPGARRRCFRWRCYASARGVRGVQGGVLGRGAALWLRLLLRRRAWCLVPVVRRRVRGTSGRSASAACGVRGVRAAQQRGSRQSYQSKRNASSIVCCRRG